MSGPTESDPSLALGEEAPLLEPQEKKVEDFRDLAQRVQADFENYRKRVGREQTLLVERANEALIIQVLPVLDNFELSLAAEMPETVRKGMELVYAELFSVLERNGLERVVPDGEVFDPNEHDAIMHDDGGGDAELVVAQTMRCGYRLKGKLLRPAMVRVTR
jgi:molecular chaperone GrpE